MEKTPQQRLSLRPRTNSALGQILVYLDADSRGKQELTAQTLQARFLPFVLDKTEPRSRGIARQCLEECLAYARAIASEWELEISGLGVTRSPQSSPNSPSDNEESSEDEEAAKEFSKTKDFLGL
ncbi:MAG: hypothetical protein J7647_05590 [Cyanobacteria bacterium SBLK]|nr:hypothetical protein [Cyanobacteria bacterium SBLK]